MLARSWCFGLVVAAASVPAQGSTRVAIVVDDVVDGDRTSESELAAALIEGLVGDSDLTVIDPAQARVVRAAIAADSLLKASPQALVGSLDADVLVVGQVDADAADGGLDLGGIRAYEARARLRVIAVDSAQILGAVRAKGIGSNLSAHLALRRAMTHVAEDALPRLRPLLTVGGRFELVVDLQQPLDAAGADDLVRCVERTPGLEGARAVHLGPDRLKVELRSAQSGRELAVTFGRDRPCGLFVYAFSSRSVRARYQPERDLSLPLRIARFEPSTTTPARDGWMAEELPRLLQAALASEAYLDTELSRAPTSRTVALKSKPGTLALVGRYARVGDQVQVQASVVATFRGRRLVGGQRTCSADAVAICATQLGSELASKLATALHSQRRAVPLDRGRTVAREATQVRIEPVAVQGVFPAKVAGYDKGARIGSLRVTNDGSESVRNVVLSAQLRGFSARPSTSDPVTLAAGSSTELPIVLWLDRAALARHSANRSAPLELAVTYDAGNLSYRVARSAATMVYDRNALHWERDPNAVAAFVDHRAPLVADLTAQAQDALEGDDGAPLESAVALFHGLDRLRYRRDPVHPHEPESIDYLQYPTETWTSNGGDCDDLAVLYAAMVEAAGLPALIVRTPGHVFTAVAVDRTELDGSLRYRGRTWVPFETTKVGGSALEAWDSAREELQRVRAAGGTPQLTEVRAAWQSYPPAEFARQAAPDVVGPDRAAIRADIQALRARARRSVAEALRTAEQSSDPRTLNRAGVRLALEGRYDEARHAFDQSIKAQATPAAVTNLGNLDLIDTGYDEAVAAYERALQLDPDHIEIHLNAVLGSYLWSLDDRAQQDRLTRHVRSAMALDREAVLAFLNRLPRTVDLPSRRATSTSLAGLSLILERELGARGSQVVAGDANDRQPLSRFVHWPH
jgi:tetratricopeptide (TPR) repeat protein